MFISAVKKRLSFENWHTGKHFLRGPIVCFRAHSLQSCPTLCDPMDCSPPGSWPQDSPGKNSGVGHHVLLQGIQLASLTSPALAGRFFHLRSPAPLSVSQQRTGGLLKADKLLLRNEISAAINAKKQRKTTEWERLEISSRKLEIPREHFMQRWAW